MTFCERLAAHFAAHPNQWVNASELMRLGGSFAWRTRCAELRKPPFNMTIENRVERHKRTEADGAVKHWTTSEYRYVKAAPARPLLELAESELRTE